MDQPTAATRVPDPDAVAFIRFCYRRRRVGWPELYDEMCAVAGRGLYRGMSSDDLAAFGIGFSLFDMPALAALAATVVAEEQALRRPVAVMITALPDQDLDAPPIDAPEGAIDTGPALASPTIETNEPPVMTIQPQQLAAAHQDPVQPVERAIRFATATAGA